MLRAYIDTAAFFSGIYSTKGYTHDRKDILKPDVIKKSGLTIVIPQDAVKAITGE